jgi:Zn-dependent protease
VTAGGAAAPRACSGCGTELPAAFLACPSCGRLVHGERLKGLAASAEAATREGNTREALTRWREALELLPVGSGQHARILATVQGLSAALDAAAPAGGAIGGGATSDAPARPKRGPLYAALAAVGALLLKFKFVLIFLLAKGKLLLAGLFQAKTMLSMVIAVGVYAAAYGWRFAVGLIVSIYVHEMGHVERLRHYGIKATAPMFIPGFGAFVRLKQYPATAREDARVGLAGPLWGAAAAVVFLALGKYTGHGMAVAVGRVGAWINLFNLIPVWQLDGGRAFNALSRRQRTFAAAALWILTFMGIDGMVLMVALGATFRAAQKDAPQEADAATLLEYMSLVLILVAVMVLGR